MEKDADIVFTPIPAGKHARSVLFYRASWFVYCRALRHAYMHSGGSDPAIVAQMIDLQAEAQSLEKNQPAAASKAKKKSKD